MGNFLALAAIAFFPLLSLVLFALQPFNRAVLWTVMSAQLLLPVGIFIKFDQIPQLDKYSVPSMCLIAAVGLALMGKMKIRPPKSFGLVGILITMYLVGPVITSEQNHEALKYGPLVLPGVGLYDAVSALILAIITLAPYIVGRELLRDASDDREILKVLVVSMLVYSLPLLFEVRFSPQLHYWVYGTYPSMFLQSMRGEGFRPMAFMGHGLIAAHFALLAFISAVTFWRTRTSVASFSVRKTDNYRAVAGYLGIVLLFCRTMGVNIYGLVLAPLILLVNPKHLVRLSVCLVVMSLLYPTLRYLDLVPTGKLLETANSISEERAESLGVRFYNERMLLAHAVEKPLFGWGRFGRNRVYDPETGKDLTLTDGEWIIVFGQFGAFGFIAEFGLLSIAVFRAAAAFRLVRTNEERIYLASLTAIVAISIFDLLPNAFLTPWTWLITGALLGRAEALLSRQAEPAAAAQAVRAVPQKLWPITETS